MQRKAPASADASRALAFERLVLACSRCCLCPRMRGSLPVMSGRNGNFRARVLFVAEAPGRLGAARTGVPLTGDQSGRNFERLLAAAGLNRQDVFITNAVLCNPLDHRGRNATPTATEVRNCRDFLLQTIRVVDPPVIVTLGSVALRTLARIVPHQLSLSTDVGQPSLWDGRWLVPMYHPGARAQVHRSFERQRHDFAGLRALISYAARD